jgi:hypothetical protein
VAGSAHERRACYAWLALTLFDRELRALFERSSPEERAAIYSWVQLGSTGADDRKVLEATCMKMREGSHRLRSASDYSERVRFRTPCTVPSAREYWRSTGYSGSMASRLSRFRLHSETVAVLSRNGSGSTPGRFRF